MDPPGFGASNVKVVLQNVSPTLNSTTQPPGLLPVEILRRLWESAWLHV